MYLIVHHTPPELKLYRRVLLCGCVLDLLFTCTIAALQVHMHVRDDVIFYTVNPLIATNVSGCFFAIAFYAFALYLTFFGAAIPFIYRYFAICRGIVMSNLTLGMVVCVEISLSLIGAVNFYVQWWPNMNRLASEMGPTVSTRCRDRPFIPLARMEDEILVTLLAVIAVYCTFITLNYIIIVVTSWRIFVKVRNSSRTTGVVSPAASQLNLVLCSQALAPLTVTGAPMLIGLALMASRTVAIGSLVEFLSGIVACMPLISPVFTMFFVRSYRRVFFIRKETHWSIRIT